jgi:ABC-type multidrug transport system ATPase subunit
LLRTNADTNKTTIVFSTHIPDDIQMICDSVFILKQGKKIVNDTVLNVMRSCEAQGLCGIEGLMLSLAANEAA